MIEMEIRTVQISSKAYHRVVLKEKDGQSCLHIVIGPNEARAISLAHNGQKPIRGSRTGRRGRLDCRRPRLPS